MKFRNLILLALLTLSACSYHKVYYMSFEDGYGFSVTPEVEYGYPDIEDVNFDKPLGIKYLWRFDGFELAGIINGPGVTPHIHLKLQTKENNLTLKVQDPRKQRYIRGVSCLQLFRKKQLSSKITWSEACDAEKYVQELDVEIVDDAQNVVFSETMTFIIKKGGHFYAFEGI